MEISTSIGLGPRLLESAEILFEIFNFNEKKVKVFENSWIRLEQ